jgi:hypothetical protein
MSPLDRALYGSVAADADEITPDDLRKAIRIVALLGVPEIAVKLMAMVQEIEDNATAFIYSQAINNPGINNTQ